jgi:hypothetical protein
MICTAEYESKNYVGSLKVLELVLKVLGVINKTFFGSAVTEIIKSSLVSFPYKTITVK